MIILRRFMLAVGTLLLAACVTKTSLGLRETAGADQILEFDKTAKGIVLGMCGPTSFAHVDRSSITLHGIKSKYVESEFALQDYTLKKGQVIRGVVTVDRT